jgi:gamma-glutamylcyclotransferase (GGCT)/AIG2-like uncharacterized protein YtfP
MSGGRFADLGTMSLQEEETERLFSYGTLQTESVQRSTFGRKLEGSPDALVGYRLTMIQIQDQKFVAQSGAAHHRMIQFTGDEADVVEGMALRVTEKELEHADAYEPAEYKRALVQLRSGTRAWVYLSVSQ